MNELKFHEFDITAAKVIQDKSREFRWLEKTNGERVLQVACPWSCGMNGGFEWRDIEIVKEQA